jgi:hypothetical protein
MGDVAALSLGNPQPELVAITAGLIEHLDIPPLLHRRDVWFAKSSSPLDDAQELHVALVRLPFPSRTLDHLFLTCCNTFCRLHGLQETHTQGSSITVHI